MPSNKQWQVHRQVKQSFPFPKQVSGRFYSSQLYTGFVSNAAQPAVDTLYAQPFFVTHTITWTKIGTHVTTEDATAPNDGRLGIYEDDSGGPGDLILDAGEFTLAGTGAKELTISQQLTTGWYWLAMVTNSGNALFSGAGVASALGWTGVLTTTGTSNKYCWASAAFTYAALSGANPFPAFTLGNTAVGAFKIYMGY